MICRYSQSIARGGKRKALMIKLFDLDQLSSLQTEKFPQEMAVPARSHHATAEAACAK
jgi:hypothetical protein